MLNIGRIGEHVVIQISDDQGAVQGEVRLTTETANLVTSRIMDAIKEIKAGQVVETKPAKPKKK